MRIRLTLAFVIGLGTPAATQSAPATSAAPTPTAQPATVTLEPPAGFTYNGAGRRDPFVSLLRRGPDVQRGSAGARPPGLSGLGAGEVTLKGTMHGRDGYIAILLGADAKTYIVRPGDRLLDGTIRTIAADSLVILQQVTDALSKQTQREVRKTLRQTEEAK
jgi:Tfp pilus assembly protein PilP